MSCTLRTAEPKIMSVDGQHTVILLQLAVSVGDPAIQHVEDKYARLVHPAHQLYAKLLLRAAFVENYVEAVVPRSIGLQCLSIASATELLLAQHRESQHLAGLPQEPQGVVMRDIADVHSIDLGVEPRDSE